MALACNPASPSLLSSQLSSNHSLQLHLHPSLLFPLSFLLSLLLPCMHYSQTVIGTDALCRSGGEIRRRGWVASNRHRVVTWLYGGDTVGRGGSSGRGRRETGWGGEMWVELGVVVRHGVGKGCNRHGDAVAKRAALPWRGTACVVTGRGGGVESVCRVGCRRVYEASGGGWLAPWSTSDSIGFPVYAAGGNKTSRRLIELEVDLRIWNSLDWEWPFRRARACARTTLQKQNLNSYILNSIL